MPRRLIAPFVALTALCVPTSLLAQPSPAEENPAGDDIVVFGRALPQIGSALSASSGTVGYADFENRSISRVGELAENVPGLIATQHSGTGKANQYFRRGFNLDHGTDLAGFVDGVPINLRSHGHGQGYLDLNFLIPELVERIDYRKGPYFADVGDFGTAGSIGFVTVDRLRAPIIEVTGGSHGYARALAAGSAGWAGGTILAAIDGTRSDGPWKLDEDLRKLNAMLKWSHGADTSKETASLSLYHASWNATDQVPLRALRSGLIDRRGNIDPYLGGRTTRATATFNLSRGDWHATAYATYYEFRLTSNFTYFLNDPVNGDEFQQRDQRTVFGASVRRQSYGGIAGMPAAFSLGGDLRYDRIGKVGLYNSVAGRISSTIRQDRIDEASGAAFADVQIWPTSALRLIAGLRADLYHYDVRGNLPVNSGQGSDAILSPKAALAWQVAKGFELYANYGEGFHSNDARGAAITVDPVGGGPVEKVDLLARARSMELGARIETGPLRASLALFRLSLASELVFVGDGGATEPSFASRRTGAEAALFWRPERWIAIDASAALTRARFRGTAPGQNHIPNAIPRVIAAGLSIEAGPDWSLNLRLRHFGSAALIEDGSVRSRQTSLVNLGAKWRTGRWRIGADIFNLLGSKANDISYYYGSRLSGEPAGGVDDYHIHPVEPRQLRLSLRYSF